MTKSAWPRCRSVLCRASRTTGSSVPSIFRIATSRPCSVRDMPQASVAVAILKIEDTELPVVRLARHSTDLHLGQALYVIGYPGVVVSHELLSRSTQYEPSITTGR